MAQNLAKLSKPSSMRAWHLYSFGGPEKLQMSQTVRVPYLTKPTDVLVQVQAASVNPLDCDMCGKVYLRKR